jgi:hypothetical protein
VKTIILALGALVALYPDQAGAQESYYVIVFGSQRPVINQPDHTHSWAVFVRVVGDPCQPGAQIDHFHVSWLPATLIVRPLKIHPEPGVNLELHRTINWALDDRQCISMWGPYQIDKCLYDSAVAKFMRLESGAVRYKAADFGYDSAYVSNCIHALADISQGPRLRIGQPGWGESASYFITLTYRPFIIDDNRTHDWLLAPLGLTQYHFTRRDLEVNPTSGLMLRGAQNFKQRRLR